MRPYNRNIYQQQHRKGLRLRKGRLLFIGLLLVLLIVVISGVRFINSFQSMQNQEEWAASLRESPRETGTNHLIFGVAQKDGEAYPDKIILYNIMEERGFPNTVFLPGETVIDVPSYGPGTLADTYVQGGSKLLVTAVKEFLDISVHHFMRIDYEVVQILAEDMGEVSLGEHDLEPFDFYDYFYQEEAEPLDTLLHRRQAFGILVENLAENYSTRHVPGLARQSSPYVETDFSWRELSSFREVAAPLFAPETTVIPLPGRWESAFYFPDEDAVGLMMDRMGEELLLPRDRITVEVLNGSGVAGVASLVADWLEEQGFSVENVDNADHFEYMYSRVIGRADMDSAREVAIFVPGSDLERDEDAERDYKVTVIVGRNFDPENLGVSGVEQPEPDEEDYN